MASTGEGLFCSMCQRQTLHVDTAKVNHVLHFLLGWLTCSLWWIVWLVIALNHQSKFACSQCGTAYDHARSTAAWNALHRGGE